MTNQYNCAPPCVELQLMQKDVDEIKRDLKAVKELLIKYDENKANKWVEKAIITFVSLLALTTLYYIFIRVGLPI